MLHIGKIVTGQILIMICDTEERKQCGVTVTDTVSLGQISRESDSSTKTLMTRRLQSKEGLRLGQGRR